MTVNDKTAPSQTESTFRSRSICTIRPRGSGARSPSPPCSPNGFCPSPGSSSHRERRSPPRRSPTQPYPGWDGTVRCRMLEIEAQKKLSYTWVVEGI